MSSYVARIIFTLLFRPLFTVMKKVDTISSSTTGLGQPDHVTLLRWTLQLLNPSPRWVFNDILTETILQNNIYLMNPIMKKNFARENVNSGGIWVSELSCIFPDFLHHQNRAFSLVLWVGQGEGDAKGLNSGLDGFREADYPYLNHRRMRCGDRSPRL